MKLDSFRDKVRGEKDITVEYSPISELNFSTNGEALCVGDLPLSPAVTRNIYQTLRISPSYADKVPLELMVPHVKYFAQKQDEKILTLIRRENQLAAVTTRPFDPLYNSRIADAIKEGIGEDVNIGKLHYDLDDTNFWITNGIQTEPRPGDITKAGIKIKNSLIGNYKPEVSLVAERLVCTNGMTRADTITQLKFTEYTKLSSILTVLWEQAQSFMDSIANTTEVRVNTDPGVLAGFLHKHGVGGRMIARILTAVTEQKPETLYDFVNILTFVGTHETKGFWGRHKLQTLGAELTREFETCGECHNILT